MFVLDVIRLDLTGGTLGPPWRRKCDWSHIEGMPPSRREAFDLCSGQWLGAQDRPGRSTQKSKAKSKEIMGNAYEIYALRYATMSPRTPSMNFLQPDPHDSARRRTSTISSG
ncbi:hypothetical protein ABH979_007997 [Bradyrhizobium ottawaense]